MFFDSQSVFGIYPVFLTPVFPPGVAVALKQAMTPEFRVYQHQVVANCKALAETLMELGYKVVTGTKRRVGRLLLALGRCPCSLWWY